jgi:hypothetical protein
MWRRAKDSLRTSVAQSGDLLPALMKSREGEAWSNDDRAHIVRTVRARRKPRWLWALTIFGGAAALGALAWALDQRRVKGRQKPGGRRKGDQSIGCIG